jgi:N,N'-diacetyllegionaminate synthase
VRRRVEEWVERLVEAPSKEREMQPVSIAGHLVGGDTPFVIAEVGVNHDGNVDTAHLLIDVAATSGAQAVKFQTFSPKALVSATAATTPYQKRAGATQSQAELLESLTLPREAWLELAEHATGQGLMFLSTPFDLASADLLVELGVPALKSPSGELTNLAFLRALAGYGLPLFVSTGMGEECEVDGAVAAVAKAPGLILFHCVSAYPAPAQECNLKAIPAMQARYGVPVGWSDHTPGATTAVVSAALGARVFEKHFTLDRNAPGPDHAASVEPDELGAYVVAVQDAVKSLGDGVKRRMASEQENAPLVRRGWHAARDLRPGHVLLQGDLLALRPETALSVGLDLVGVRLQRGVAAGEPLQPEDCEPPLPHGSRPARESLATGRPLPTNER